VSVFNCAFFFLLLYKSIAVTTIATRQSKEKTPPKAASVSICSMVGPLLGSAPVVCVRFAVDVVENLEVVRSDDVADLPVVIGSDDVADLLVVIGSDDVADLPVVC